MSEEKGGEKEQGNQKDRHRHCKTETRLPCSCRKTLGRTMSSCQSSLKKDCSLSVLNVEDLRAGKLLSYSTVYYPSGPILF